MGQIRIFEFDFIDHQMRKCHKICVCVHASERIEWSHKEDDIEGYISWMGDHLRWEHKLKETIKQKVLEANPELGKKGNNHIGDFKILKFGKEKRMCAVNLNVENEGQSPKFRKTKLMEICRCKCVKGKCPEKWTEIFDYEKITKNYSFVLESSMKNNNITLVEVCRFDLGQSMPEARNEKQAGGYRDRRERNDEQWDHTGGYMERNDEQWDHTGGYQNYKREADKYKRKYFALKHEVGLA